MKKIIFLLTAISCSAFGLDDNPIAPPKAEIIDKFGVNMQSGQLSRSLSTVSIGGALGLTHSVQLFTDLFADGNYYGYTDAFAGRLTRKTISNNIVNVVNNSNGDPIFFRDTGSFEYDYTQRIIVVRPYGPAGSHDFLMYQNGVLDRAASATSGYTFKAVGDSRHTLVENADKSYMIWTTPDGIESKYESSGRLVEVTYPNGYKVRIFSKGVTTNTGFMLKYQLNSQGLGGTPDQIVALNLAYQYCSPTATSCSNTGWPTATFTWPVGTPSSFWTPGLPSSSYLVKLTTSAGVTDIQYQPENLCITNLGYEDSYCSTHQTGLGKWSPRLKSIKTPGSTIPNYQYTYNNIGVVTSGNADGYFPYWYLSTRVGQIETATLNGTDTEGYGGPSISPGTSTRNSSEIMAESAQYDLNVINSAWTKKGGNYTYYKDARNFVEIYQPVAGLGPKQHYYYNGPRGNLNLINSISPSGNESRLTEAGYVTTCTYPKTCNKPLWVKDARGNVTNYEYDPLGRFGSPTKIIAPANKNGVRATTVYTYSPMYAYYKKDGEAITQDPDPVWLLTSEFTCRTTSVSGSGCAGGEIDTIRTSYYYGPQVSGQANNLLLRGKSIAGEGNLSGTTRTIETHVTCYEYDKYGHLIGETLPKGNSTNLESCQ